MSSGQISRDGKSTPHIYYNAALIIHIYSERYEEAARA